MYTVNRVVHEVYGSVIVIKRDMNGSQLTPFQAVQCACKERRLWLESGSKKVRILIDGQVMSPNQAEHWADDEYSNIPKCQRCASFLNDKVYTHQFSSDLFCSEDCLDIDYNEHIEKLKDEEDIDYL